METILSIPLDIIMLASLAIAAAAASFLLVQALRQPLLARLALRNPMRRPAQSFLVTLGLTLSAIIAGTALNTGDTISHTVRILVASGVGRADEVVVALPRDQQRSLGEYTAALLDGTLLTGLGGYFSENQWEALATAMAGDPRVAGLMPVIREQATVINPEQQLVQSQISLLALPPDYPRAFGPLLSLEQEAISLGDLAPADLLVDADAATQLGIGAGSQVAVRVRDNTFPLRVSAVIQRAELVGGTASGGTLILALSEYQRLAGRQGQINQILVANRGDSATSVRLSSEVARSVRVALANRAAAQAIFNVMRLEPGQREITNLIRNTEGRQRQKLEALHRTLSQTQPTDEFINLVTDPELERRLFALGPRLAAASGVSLASLGEISPLRVLEIKQAGQDQAERWGGALTSIFLVLGLFSLAAGVLLVFLIFITLATERRTELGVLRAVGARKKDIVLAFLLEGGLYDAVASGAGLLLGILVTLVMTNVADAALQQYGVRLSPHFEVRSLVVAYCLGLLLTFISVGLSAWRIGQLSIVAAIRDLPSQPRHPRPRWRALAPFSLVVLGLGLVWFGVQQLALPQASGVGLALVGLALIGRALLGRAGLAAGASDRLAYSCCGGGLVGYWLLPSDWPLPVNGRLSAGGMDLFFLAGLSMVLGAVWISVYNLTWLVRPLLTMTTRLGSLGLALRLASANPLQHRLRTGMVTAMFALVMFSMVMAGVLLTASHRAYSDPEALSGGFDIRAEVDRPAALPDLRSALGDASTIRAEDIVSVGRLATRPGQVLELGPGIRRWQPYNLREIDSSFIAGLRSPLVARANGFASDGEAWDVVESQPGYAMVAGPAVGSRQELSVSSTGFRFAELSLEDQRFSPRDLWIRDERGGRATKITVVGVMDPRVSFGAGLYTGAGTFDTAAAPSPQRLAYYLKSQPGTDPAALALGVNLSFNDRGLRATAIGEEVRRIQSVRILLNELLQGFFAVGLLAGLAALGVISVRAIVERRQQIGVLRALGFGRHMVRLSLLLETTLVALLGIGLGVGLGLALSQRLVSHLGRQYPEIVFGIPWQQIGLLAFAAYLAALLLSAWPLWRIGRIRPTEALSFE